MAGRLLIGGAGALGLLFLAACDPAKVSAPSRADLGIEQIRLKGDGPPKGPDGACWASSVKPAVIETVTEQRAVTEEIRDETGRITTPASFQTSTHQRMVQEREVVWFRAPCAEDMTVSFIATLQRALKARGLYLLPVTGINDAATAEAVRRYQAERGLDSPVLSLGAARELGISTTDLDRL